jgi:hypothetical protein
LGWACPPLDPPEAGCGRDCRIWSLDGKVDVGATVSARWSCIELSPCVLWSHGVLVEYYTQLGNFDDPLVSAELTLSSDRRDKNKGVRLQIPTGAGWVVPSCCAADSSEGLGLNPCVLPHHGEPELLCFLIWARTGRWGLFLDLIVKGSLLR